MSEGRVLVVIPTYNEKDNLPKVVPLVLELLKEAYRASDSQRGRGEAEGKRRKR